MCIGEREPFLRLAGGKGRGTRVKSVLDASHADLWPRLTPRGCRIVARTSQNRLRQYALNCHILVHLFALEIETYFFDSKSEVVICINFYRGIRGL